MLESARRKWWGRTKEEAAVLGAFRALERDRRRADRAANRAKRAAWKRMTPEERRAEKALIHKLGKVGEQDLTRIKEQAKSRRKDDRRVTREDKRRKRRLRKKEKYEARLAKRRAKRDARREKTRAKHVRRCAKRWPKIHADAAFAVHLFAWEKRVERSRLTMAAAALQRFRDPKGRQPAYAAAPPPKFRRARRDDVVVVETAVAWLADVAGAADLARPVKPTKCGGLFRKSRRKCWREAVDAAALLKVRKDAADAARDAAVADFRKVRPPRQCCAAYGAGFGTRRALAEHLSTQGKCPEDDREPADVFVVGLRPPTPDSRPPTPGDPNAVRWPGSFREYLRDHR